MIFYNQITSFYVDGVNGSDSNTGLSPTLLKDGNAPLLTVGEALRRVIELRKTGVLQPLSIKLAAGDYFIESAIEITSDAYDITIEPYGNARVTFIGGRRINGFSETTANGHRAFVAYIPEVERGEWRFSDLYVDSYRAEFTRYPEEGFLYASDVENHGQALYDHSDWFVAEKGSFPDFENVEDCFISYNHFWIDEHTPIKSYDKESGRVTMQYRSRFSIAGGKDTSSHIEYIIENSFEMLSKPNQWYLNTKTGMLYYIPANDKMTPDNITVYAPRTEKLFELRGTPGKKLHGVRLRGLGLCCTRGDYASGGNVFGVADSVQYASDPQSVANAGGAVTFADCDACALEDCVLYHFGLHGIVIGLGCENVRVCDCDIFDGGAGGIKVVGAPFGGDEALMTRGSLISGNKITACGRRYLSACGILIMHSSCNTVSHNDISDLYYTGISCGWVWGYAGSSTHDNIIEYNRISNLGQGRLSDMGGVYLLGKQSGTIVRGNLIHDIKSRHYGGWALYTDEGSSYMTIEDNICYNTSNNSYHQHYGSMNTVRNNIFAFSGVEMIRVSRPETHLCISFECNIILSDGAPIFGLDRKHYNGGLVSSVYNIIFDRKRESPIFAATGDNSVKSFAEVKESGLEYGSVVTDPLFADADSYDFNLLPDSPALALGFKPIDMNKAGIAKLNAGASFVNGEYFGE